MQNHLGRTDKNNRDNLDINNFIFMISSLLDDAKNWSTLC